MRLELFQIDAFTSRMFSGNPAAVCPLDAWLPDGLMQQIALENNLSETAFFVPGDQRFALRWFTPTTEVQLCGHATLASAFVIWEYLAYQGPLTFDTASGPLHVTRDGDLIVLDFPLRPASRSDRPPQDLIAGLGVEPEAVLASEDGGSGFYLAVYRREADLRALSPDLERLSRLGRMGVVVTAPGESSDFSSRCFAPTFGINEDPVTGSTHCFLTPYWAGRLGKQKLHARQVSRRGGELFCELAGDRVRIGGRAVCYMKAAIELPE